MEPAAAVLGLCVHCHSCDSVPLVDRIPRCLGFSVDLTHSVRDSAGATPLWLDAVLVRQLAQACQVTRLLAIHVMQRGHATVNDMLMLTLTHLRHDLRTRQARPSSV